MTNGPVSGDASYFSFAPTGDVGPEVGMPFRPVVATADGRSSGATARSGSPSSSVTDPDGFRLSRSDWFFDEPPCTRCSPPCGRAGSKPPAPLAGREDRPRGDGAPRRPLATGPRSHLHRCSARPLPRLNAMRSRSRDRTVIRVSASRLTTDEIGGGARTDVSRVRRGRGLPARRGEGRGAPFCTHGLCDLVFEGPRSSGSTRHCSTHLRGAGPATEIYLDVEHDEGLGVFSSATVGGGRPDDGLIAVASTSSPVLAPGARGAGGDRGGDRGGGPARRAGGGVHPGAPCGRALPRSDQPRPRQPPDGGTRIRGGPQGERRAGGPARGDAAARPLDRPADRDPAADRKHGRRPGTGPAPFRHRLRPGGGGGD